MKRSQFLQDIGGADAAPDVSVENAALRPRQRRIALATIWVPLLGSAVAGALAVRYGVSGVDLGLLAGGFVLTSVGLEVGFHRAFAHRAFMAKRGVALVLGVLGSMAAEGRVLYWVASHRRHHAHSDTPDDPHSPHVRRVGDGSEHLPVASGLWHAHIGHMITDRITNCTLFARDLARDSMLRAVSDWYVPIVLAGLALPALIGGLARGSWYGALSGFLWGGLVRMFLVHHTTWSVASLCHVFGGKPYATGDQSRNNLWVALPSFGSAYQNNHHAFPTSAFLGLEWWEIDLGGMVVRVLAALRLVSGVRRPSAVQIERKKRTNGGRADEIITVC
jgi:stearoyl-CoA desaturase (Delta-9 desaturase)